MGKVSVIHLSSIQLFTLNEWADATQAAFQAHQWTDMVWWKTLITTVSIGQIHSLFLFPLLRMM